jgi:hypothetical protein
MKKVFSALMALIIISLFVPEKTKAQDSTTSKISKIATTGQFKTSADYRRGWSNFIGIDMKAKEDDSKFPNMEAYFSFSVPVTTMEMTSFGLTYVVYPWKRGFGKLFGFELEGIYCYDSKINMYSELFYGGLGQNTIKDLFAQWTTKRLVFTPAVEFSVPIGKKLRVGTKVDLIFGYWNFNADSKGYSRWHRWYDIDLLFVSLNLGKND